MTLTIRLRHAFAGFTLDVDITTGPGVTALFGRSGSGKTTIVNAVAGLLRPDEGTIRLDNDTLLDTATNRFLPPHRRRMGYVFQDSRLFPHLTVRQNLTYARALPEPKPSPSTRSQTSSASPPCSTAAPPPSRAENVSAPPSAAPSSPPRASC